MTRPDLSDDGCCRTCGKPWEAHFGDHRTRILIHRDQGEVEIDEEIAPLIDALWKRGINTIASYQADSSVCGYMWLLLEIWDAEEFLNRIAGRYREREDSRIARAGFHGRILGMTEHTGLGEWVYSASPSNLGLDYDWDTDRHYRTGPNYIHFKIHLCFPRTDLPLVMKRVLASPEAEPKDQLTAGATEPEAMVS